MGCGFFKKQTMALLAIMLLSAVLLSVSAGVEELKGTDSWKSDDAGFEVIDNVMVLEGDAKTVVFDNEHNLNEPLHSMRGFPLKNPLIPGLPSSSGQINRKNSFGRMTAHTFS